MHLATFAVRCGGGLRGSEGRHACPSSMPLVLAPRVSFARVWSSWGDDVVTVRSGGSGKTDGGEASGSANIRVQIGRRMNSTFATCELRVCGVCERARRDLVQRVHERVSCHGHAPLDARRRVLAACGRGTAQSAHAIRHGTQDTAARRGAERAQRDHGMRRGKFQESDAHVGADQMAAV